MNAAYQGAPGAYGEQALLRYFPEGTPAQAFATFADVFAAVASGACTHGVVPIENSITGSVTENYDLLGAQTCYVCGEIRVDVRHCLVGAPGATLETVREVFSHPQGFLQCHNFLQTHPDWVQTPYHNTAVSARHVARLASPGYAAIASEHAAAVHGLCVLARGIQSAPDNQTRFFILSSALREEGDKATLRFTLPHTRGALALALGCLAIAGMNLTHIESRPIAGQNWAYAFFADIECCAGDALTLTLERLRAVCSEITLLGRYDAGAYG